MDNKQNLILTAIVALILILWMSLFTVKEGERAIIVRFGKVVKTSSDDLPKVIEPGLHLKLPVIDTVKMLDARIQTVDDQRDSRFFTSEKKEVLINYYVKWKINEFEKYYLTTAGDRLKATNLLSSRINNGLRAEVANRTIKQIVSGERDEVMAKALIEAQAAAKSLGIEVLDVRIKKLNLPDNISEDIFKRMIANRKAVATEHRSKGAEQAEIIQSQADRGVTVLLAEAQREAKIVKGQADALAAEIYIEAYSQDPEFFDFWRSMEAYQQSFITGSENVLILNPKNEFFRYMNAK